MRGCASEVPWRAARPLVADSGISREATALYEPSVKHRRAGERAARHGGAEGPRDQDGACSVAPDISGRPRKAVAPSPPRLDTAVCGRTAQPAGGCAAVPQDRRAPWRLATGKGVRAPRTRPIRYAMARVARTLVSTRDGRRGKRPRKPLQPLRSDTHSRPPGTPIPPAREAGLARGSGRRRQGSGPLSPGRRRPAGAAPRPQAPPSRSRTQASNSSSGSGGL